MSRVALVLAAGSARRFGSDKLSAPFHDAPLVFHAIRAARAAPVERVIVVAAPGLDTGVWHGAPPVEPARIASTALSESLKAGLAAAGAVDEAFVFLGDMPLVPTGVAAQLAAALGDGFAAIPRHAGRNGHPVLLSRAAMAAVAGLSGDEGLGRVLKSRGDVVFVDVPDDAILFDVDRPDDLAGLAARPLDKD